MCVLIPKQTDEDVLRRIYRLDREHQGRGKIIQTLHEEFPEELVPDESTVTRRIKKFRETPSADLAEDDVFAWSSMREPWEGSGAILDAWSFYEREGYERKFGPFTRRFAKWTWRVAWAMGNGNSPVPMGLQASINPELSEGTAPMPQDPLLWAMEYAWREIEAIVFGRPLATREIDKALAIKPWQSEEQLAQFHESRDSEGRPLIQIHYMDMIWLESPSMPIADLWRTKRQEGDRDTKLAPQNVAARPFEDGLLGTQLGNYHGYPYRPHEMPVPGNPMPWYWFYLDNVYSRLSGRDESEDEAERVYERFFGRES